MVLRKNALILVLTATLSMATSSLEVWKDMPEDPIRLKMPKPTTWKEKPMGQWCSNVSTRGHKQCPEVLFPALSQYDCCGESGVECCWSLQGWVYIVVMCMTVVGLSSLVFHILLKMNLICIEERETKGHVTKV